MFHVFIYQSKHLHSQKGIKHQKKALSLEGCSQQTEMIQQHY